MCGGGNSSVRQLHASRHSTAEAQAPSNERPAVPFISEITNSTSSGSPLASTLAMSAPDAVVSQKLDTAGYSALVVEPALAVVLAVMRKRLLQYRPFNVFKYISQHFSQIYFEIEAAASAVPASATGESVQLDPSAVCVGASTSTVAALAAPCPTEAGGAATLFPAQSLSSATAAAAASPADSTPAALVSFPSVSSSSTAAATAASPADPTPLSPRPAAVGGRSACLSTASGAGGKFDTFVMPCGKLEDFHKGVSSRIGFPHLEFEKTMEAEHCSMAGCDMRFITRNYGITTTANAEWGVVVRGQTPPPEHMLHGRIMVSVEDKLLWINEQFAKKGLEVRLRREEVIAVILYTGPMYMIYNCVLARWSNPAAMWDTIRGGNNLFTTTLSCDQGEFL